MILNNKRPSLENLITSEELNLEILHPGGFEITEELARLCDIHKGKNVLDVASGTGESAFFLEKKFKCSIIGIDISNSMIRRSVRKAIDKGIIIQFKKADAQDIPFKNDTFDAVISECMIDILEKDGAIEEMIRIARPGAYIGIHNFCWKEDAPEVLKQKFSKIEGVELKTAGEWRQIFEKAGLIDINIIDRSNLISEWEKNILEGLGTFAWLKICFKIINKWGIAGLMTIRESRKIIKNQHSGYSIIVGKKQ